MVFLGQILIDLGFFDEGPVGWVIGIGSLYIMWIIIGEHWLISFNKYVVITETKSSGTL